MERLNKQIKRRTYVVDILPDEPSVIRLMESVLMKITDEWQVGRRYFSQGSMLKLLDPEPVLVSDTAPFRLELVH